MTLVEPNGEQLGIIAQLIADGKIKLHVEDVIPLEKAKYTSISPTQKMEGDWNIVVFWEL